MINKKKLIEIRKAGFVNKGAELMLCAILSKIEEEFPDVEFAMETGYGPAPYKKRAQKGFYQKAQFYKYGFQFGVFLNFIPKKIRDLFGIVTDKEIDVVLDAAGFAYGDQWGPIKTKQLASSCKRWKKNGTKVILLPQAFGPFKNEKIRKYIKDVVDNCDLVFAREKSSYEYLIEVVGQRDNIKLYPDFTNLVAGVKPEYFDPALNEICIVPNKQMVVMAGMKHEAYIAYLSKVTSYYLQQGARPFFLVHETGNDKKIADAVNEKLTKSVPVIVENNPVLIKGIIGASKATVGSRFHGLVSALSQGIPSVSMGWSHKYEELFKDYNFSEGIVDISADDSTLFEKLGMLINAVSHKAISEKLIHSSSELKVKSENMWAEVLEVINHEKN
jgi:polysaccharide pyruvyl transferase WcaK-like protein